MKYYAYSVSLEGYRNKKWGRWTGDSFEGCFNNDQACGEWVWDEEQELVSGEVIIATKKITVNTGNPQAITDAPDDFRKNNERLRTAANVRELAKRG